MREHFGEQAERKHAEACGTKVDTSSTDAIAATTTPGALGVGCGAGVNLSTISPAKTAAR
ncbi:MAG: hypothetical protein IH897_10520 [Planctomycetes bacterium]|nr:hypothetical protein [Planctomycetota bacterium]